MLAIMRGQVGDHGAASVPAGPVVLGVDIGTTATKAVAYDVDGTAHGSGHAAYPLQEPSPGAAVQDPEAICEAVGDAVNDAADEARHAGRTVAAVSFSSAMHGLLARDDHDDPLTPLFTWADNRAAGTARELRVHHDALALHRRTGTPVHPMSPMVKLAWLRHARPSLHAQTRTWGGIKELVLARAVGRRITDESCASGTGLRALDGGEWDPGALEIAGVDADHLDRLVAPSEVVGTLRDVGWGLPTGTPVVAGGGDGPMANLGLGAVRPGVVACSIGTSGALRVAVDRPHVDARGRVFCYVLADGLWTVGGATTNGGVVLDWASEAFGGSPAELLERAAAVPAGADGLLALPHLLAERAPRWDPAGAGALVGLRRTHGPGHIVRALLEAVCLQLRLVLDSMREAGIRLDEVRATGGFVRSTFWRQLLTDALGVPVTFPSRAEGSALGAALLGMQGVGLLGAGVEPLERVARRTGSQDDRTLTPGPDADLLARRLPMLERLPDDLAEVLAALS